MSTERRRGRPSQDRGPSSGQRVLLTLVVGLIFFATPVMLWGPSSGDHEEHPHIPWELDFERALVEAERRDTLVVVDAYATWCGPCQVMDLETFHAPSVMKAMVDFVPFRFDVDRDPELAAKLRAEMLPTTLILDPHGGILLREQQLLLPGPFLAMLRQGQEAERRFRDLRDAAERQDGSAGAALDYADQLAARQRLEEAQAAYRTAWKRSPLHSPESDLRARAMLGAGHALSVLERYAEALPFLEELVAQASSLPAAAEARELLPRALALRGRELQRSGDRTQALPLYDRVIALAPDSPAARLVAEWKAQDALVGAVAPTLTIDEWISSEPDLSELAGKIRMVDFFEVDCEACDASRPALERMQERYRDRGLRILGLAVVPERPGEAPTTNEEIRRAHLGAPRSYPVAIDRNRQETFRSFGARSAPWTALIDPEGILAYLGPFDESKVEAALQALLQEQ